MRSLLSLMAIALITVAVGCNDADKKSADTPAKPAATATDKPAETKTSENTEAPANAPADASKGEVQTVSLNVPGMT